MGSVARTHPRLSESASARIADEAFEYGTAPRRQAVADLEALGETGFLQPSDATLERRHLGVDLRRQRLKASVTRPSAMPCRMSQRNSIRPSRGLAGGGIEGY